jgi:hypothetical protein
LANFNKSVEKIRYINQNVKKVAGIIYNELAEISGIFGLFMYGSELTD